MAKIKTFCKWSGKDILKNMDLLSKLTSKPEYACRKCARVSNTKKSLCKPVALSTKAYSI
ncbi:hypothetical protein BSZ32_15335 [Rubritalea profundi]|uniref:Uncharacterized protein n=1 Tax=Rubritalea profundi TaxID=1658618 RepID=A0A2S7U3X8_9BACT|nr:hypothetical protein BSZ32_15335 [Rubritalea profundi]